MSNARARAHARQNPNARAFGAQTLERALAFGKIRTLDARLRAPNARALLITSLKFKLN